MNKIYNGKRMIGVLELSSTALKSLSGTPKAFVKNPQALGRFRTNIIPFLISDYIDGNNFLEIARYEKHILPQILKMLKWLLGFSPQAIRVVATGHYRNIENADEFVAFMDTHLKRVSNGKIKGIYLLTPEQESLMSFKSWLHTSTPLLNHPDTEDIFFFLNKGIAIDLGGGTTEITIIENMNFKNTISLPLGGDLLNVDILNIHFVDRLHFSKYVRSKQAEIKKNIISFLKESFSVPDGIRYCICTGSNLIVEGGDEYNSRNTNKTEVVEHYQKEYFHMVMDIILPYLEKKEIIPDRHFKYLMNYTSFVIFSAVIEYFKIPAYHLNHANLRIGVFYELWDELKNQN